MIQICCISIHKNPQNHIKMNAQKDLVEFGKSKFTQWKSMIEELELQLSLGKAEARDAIKREKKNISKFFNEQKAQYKKAEKKVVDQRMDLERSLQELIAMISAKEPTNKRAYNTRRKDLMKGIHQLEYMLNMVVKECNETLKIQLLELKGVLDHYRIQLALSEYENRKSVNPSQNALYEKLLETEEMLSEISNREGSKIEYFMDEITQSFDHLKQAFSEIL